MVAEEAAKEVSKAVSNDIAVFRTKFDVETGKGRKRVLMPVEAELHINPVSIAIAAAAALLGTLAGTIAWHGINIPSPLGGAIELMPGIKDTTLGQDINSWYERQKLERQLKAMGAEVVTAKPGAAGETVLDPECSLLSREYMKALRRGDMAAADRFLAQAKAKGCLWAEQVNP